MNSHGGTGSIKAAMTPIRVVCENTLEEAQEQIDTVELLMAAVRQFLRI